MNGLVSLEDKEVFMVCIYVCKFANVCLHGIINFG
jgi:hypothetical protein